MRVNDLLVLLRLLCRQIRFPWICTIWTLNQWYPTATESIESNHRRRQYVVMAAVRLHLHMWNKSTYANADYKETTPYECPPLLRLPARHA